MLLRIGSIGNDVKKVQEKLGLSLIDGVFGPLTESAVKKWQTLNGLTADGVIGPITWSKMFGNNGTVLDRLRGHVPDNVINQISNISNKFQINTALRLSHFLAQCGYESMNFLVLEENLNYTAEGLRKIFPKYFPGALSESYAKNPIKIASRVYANRMGNGNEASGEGYKFRGRGFIQLTGKSNYMAFGKSIGVDVCSNPDLVATKYPLVSAAWFFSGNGLNKIADLGSSDEIVKKITIRICGGTRGLSQRISNFNKFYSLLT